MKYQNNGMSLARCMHCFNFVARLIYTRSSIYCEPLVSHVLRLRPNQIVGTSEVDGLLLAIRPSDNIPMWPGTDSNYIATNIHPQLDGCGFSHKKMKQDEAHEPECSHVC